jgi:hypothetical protein
MSGFYAEGQAEVIKTRDARREAQNMADNTEWERKAADRRMKNDFKGNFNEFTRALQT